MTDRLHILERERERLEKALAADRFWVALLKARPDFVVGGAIQDVPEDIAAGLMANELFVAYARTVDALERLKQPSLVGSGTGDAKPRHSEGSAFRTRVNVKSSLPSEVQPREVVETSVPLRQDDLTVIRRIDRKLAQELNAQGVFTFETIAGWDRYEVRRVRDALDLGKRIWRENWIEQAELLRLRMTDEQPTVVETQTVAVPVVEAEPSQPQPDKTSRVDEELRTSVAKTNEPPGDRTATGAEIIALPVIVADRAVEEVAPDNGAETTSIEMTVPLQGSDEELIEVAARDETPVAKEIEPRETLKVGKRPSRLPAPATRRFAYIRGVGDDLAEALRSAGVMSFADIAAWSRADVKWFQAILGDDARISQDQWIEQAALLAKGVWTRFALRVVSGETRLVVQAPMPVAVGVGLDATTGAVEAADPLPAPTPDDEDIASLEIAAPIEEPVVNLEPENAPATTVHLDRKEQFNPLCGLTTTIALDKIKRPQSEFSMRVLRVEPGKVLPPPLPKTPPKPSSASPQEEKPEVVTTATHSVSDAEAQSEVSVVRLDLDEAVTEFNEVDALDDWDDAEALVVRRVEQPQPPTDAIQPRPVPETFPGSEVLPARVTAQIDDSLDVAPWGDEAEVVIVTAGGTRDTVSDVGAAPVAKNTTDGRESRDDRETLGHSAALIARRMQDTRDQDDDYGPDHVGYRDSVEEATVTIIRAESSETDAASIVPREIANDADAPDESARRPKARRIGSRFLKALTGE